MRNNFLESYSAGCRRTLGNLRKNVSKTRTVKPVRDEPIDPEVISPARLHYSYAAMRASYPAIENEVAAHAAGWAARARKRSRISKFSSESVRSAASGRATGTGTVMVEALVRCCRRAATEAPASIGASSHR